MQKSNNAGESCPHRGDTDPPVLLMLDKGLKVNPFNLLQILLARLSIKGEEKHGCRVGTPERPRFLVHAPLVPHVALEVFFGGKLLVGDLSVGCDQSGLSRMLLTWRFTFY